MASEKNMLDSTKRKKIRVQVIFKLGMFSFISRIVMSRILVDSLQFLVESPAIDLVIINVLLIITNHLIEIEIDRYHIILIACPLIWSCFKSHN